MNKMTRHPLRLQEDILKKALVLNGFKVYDHGQAHEIEIAQWSFNLFDRPYALQAKPLFIENGTYILRSELLTAQLAHISQLARPTEVAHNKAGLSLKACCAGHIYDARDEAIPCHTHIEGIWCDKTEPLLHDLARFWSNVAKSAYGARTYCTMKVIENNVYAIDVTLPEKESFTLAYMAQGNEIAQALLGLCDSAQKAWFFVVDVDQVTMNVYNIASREALYNPAMSVLQKIECDAPTYNNYWHASASDLLRAAGFCEFSGTKLYPDDCYRKMNMIQESWDTNNAGVLLDEPLGKATGLPTVLTPALEEALAQNYRAGEVACRIFEFGHIFVPQRNKAPIEKIALSFGAYGDDLDKQKWKKLVDTFLTDFGIANHFFIPTDMAIAYDTSDCWLIMDECMHYLECNFGSISPKALENHGIGVPAYMAQFEFAPLEAKARAEFHFTPNEYR